MVSWDVLLQISGKKLTKTFILLHRSDNSSNVSEFQNFPIVLSLGIQQIDRLGLESIGVNLTNVANEFKKQANFLLEAWYRDDDSLVVSHQEGSRTINLIHTMGPIPVHTKT